jgi:hypothetical protein
MEQESNPRFAALRRGTRAFRGGLIFSALPFVAMVIVIYAMVGRGAELVWMATLGLCVVGLLVSGIFALAEKRRIALGILAGIAIGLAGLVVSCTTVLSS